MHYLTHKIFSSTEKAYHKDTSPKIKLPGGVRTEDQTVLAIFNDFQGYARGQASAKITTPHFVERACMQLINEHQSTTPLAEDILVTADYIFGLLSNFLKTKTLRVIANPENKFSSDLQRYITALVADNRKAFGDLLPIATLIDLIKQLQQLPKSGEQVFQELFHMPFGQYNDDHYFDSLSRKLSMEEKCKELDLMVKTITPELRGSCDILTKGHVRKALLHLSFEKNVLTPLAKLFLIHYTAQLMSHWAEHGTNNKKSSVHIYIPEGFERIGSTTNFYFYISFPETKMRNTQRQTLALWSAFTNRSKKIFDHLTRPLPTEEELCTVSDTVAYLSEHNIISLDDFRTVRPANTNTLGSIFKIREIDNWLVTTLVAIPLKTRFQYRMVVKLCTEHVPYEVTEVQNILDEYARTKFGKKYRLVDYTRFRSREYYFLPEEEKQYLELITQPELGPNQWQNIDIRDQAESLIKYLVNENNPATSAKIINFIRNKYPGLPYEEKKLFINTLFKIAGHENVPNEVVIKILKSLVTINDNLLSVEDKFRALALGGLQTSDLEICTTLLKKTSIIRNQNAQEWKIYLEILLNGLSWSRDFGQYTSDYENQISLLDSFIQSLTKSITKPGPFSILSNVDKVDLQISCNKVRKEIIKLYERIEESQHQPRHRYVAETARRFLFITALMGIMLQKITSGIRRLLKKPYTQYTETPVVREILELRRLNYLHQAYKNFNLIEAKDIVRNLVTDNWQLLEKLVRHDIENILRNKLRPESFFSEVRNLSDGAASAFTLRAAFEELESALGKEFIYDYAADLELNPEDLRNFIHKEVTPRPENFFVVHFEVLTLLWGMLKTKNLEFSYNVGLRSHRREVIGDSVHSSLAMISPTEAFANIKYLARDFSSYKTLELVSMVKYLVERNRQMTPMDLILINLLFADRVEQEEREQFYTPLARLCINQYTLGAMACIPVIQKVVNNPEDVEAYLYFADKTGEELRDSFRTYLEIDDLDNAKLRKNINSYLKSFNLALFSPSDQRSQFIQYSPAFVINPFEAFLNSIQKIINNSREQRPSLEITIDNEVNNLINNAQEINAEYLPPIGVVLKIQSRKKIDYATLVLEKKKLALKLVNTKN